MKGKIQLLLVFTICAFTIYIIARMGDRITWARVARGKLQLLPAVPMVDLDSATFSIPTGEAIVVVLFDTSCDHCGALAQSFRSSFVDTPSVRVVWISIEKIDDIRNFGVAYDLLGHQNIYFARMNQEAMVAIFGSLATPRIFVYTRDGILKEEFKGAVSWVLVNSVLP